MKNPVLSEEVAKTLYTCIVCSKKIREIYGRWGDVGGTCNRACEKLQEQKPKDFGENNHATLPKKSN